MLMPLLKDADIAELREALADAGYTVDVVRDVLGARASAALDRNETTPGIAATVGGSALETLTRLWPLQASVPRAAAEDAVPLEPLLQAGIVTEHGDEITAAIDIRPYADDAGDWWVVADLTPGLDGRREPVPHDHVLGVNAASSTLAQITVREPVTKALDLGTGCGVQALHLSRHCTNIVATDVNERALGMAATTVRLNGLAVDVRRGSLYEPVRDERFDLIATNPPFVVSPGGQHVYRDSGFAGDELSRRVIQDGAARLNDGGLLQSMANWMHVGSQPWEDRVAEWITTPGFDAWVIQREVQDPAEYVELWLRDAGTPGQPGYVEEYDSWLAWFDENKVEGIGFGWVFMRASGADQPTIRIEDWPHVLEQPFGPTVADWFSQLGGTPASDEELLGTHLVVSEGVTQEQIGRPGDEDPEHLVLRQRHGMMRARQVDTALAGFVGACDGTLSVGVIIDALATVLDVDADNTRSQLLPVIRELCVEGFLSRYAGNQQ